MYKKRQEVFQEIAWASLPEKYCILCEPASGKANNKI